jgi:hypothetical protein
MMTIFANMMVNDHDRFKHLRDSVRSFRDVSDNWLINIRGSLRQEVMDFLQQELGDKMIAFELLDEKRGWFNNALEMLEQAKYDYMLIWCEDHLNLADADTYHNIISEMKQEKADYLMYSWWLGGKCRKAFEVDELKKHKHIDTIELTKSIWKRQLKNGYRDHLVSLIAIVSRDFFVSALRRENNKLPRWITTNIFRTMIILRYFGLKFNHRYYFDSINVLLKGKLTRFPKDRPFDIEKSCYRLDVLPFKMALPRQELFACIDDDLGVEGYQLIKRGLYPVVNNFTKSGGSVTSSTYGSEEILNENDDYKIVKHSLYKGQSYSKVIFPDEHRIEKLPMMMVINLGDDLLFQSNGGSVVLSSGESLKFYSNIKYQFMAQDNNCSFIVMSPKGLY